MNENKNKYRNVMQFPWNLDFYTSKNSAGLAEFQNKKPPESIDLINIMLKLLHIYMY